MFENLTNKFEEVFSSLKKAPSLDEKQVDEGLRGIRQALLEADVTLDVAKQFIENVKPKALGQEIIRSTSPGQMVVKIVYDELVKLLGEKNEDINLNAVPPVPMMLVGLQGSGKTTTTAKLAEWYRRRHGVRVAVIEADVHRPGAYNQLSQLLEDSSVEVYGEPDNKNAVDIVKNGLKQHAAADLVIIDTAGRHKLDEDLVVELEQISEVANANERFLVIDAQVGQSAGPVAANFHDLAGVTGIVITKLDGTARGGGALSAVATTGAPVMYIGTGEKVADLEKFESDRFISRLLGMGDIRGLIDLAPEDMDEEEAMRITQRMMTGRFTLNDMYSQMEMMSKVGTIDKLLSFLPSGMFGGMGAMGKNQKEAMQANLDRYRVIMDSMTTYEKDEPAKIKADRIRRIARGSGVKEKDVRELIGQWNRSRKMMNCLLYTSPSPRD